MLSWNICKQARKHVNVYHTSLLYAILLLYVSSMQHVHASPNIPVTPQAHSGIFSIPTTGTVTGRFGDIRSGKKHLGVDISSNAQGNYSRGKEVYAPYGGTVTRVRDDYSPCAAGVAHIVEIDHGYIAARGKYVKTLYAHMASHDTKQSYIQVSQGSKVVQGQLIGYQGDALRVVNGKGCATGVHLHWTVYESDTATAKGVEVNPELYTGTLGSYVTETSSQHYVNTIDCAQTKSQGDADCSGKVDISDLSILARYWKTNDTRADFNRDGIVDIGDLSILAKNWQKWVASTASASGSTTRTTASIMTANSSPIQVSFGNTWYNVNGDQGFGVDVILEGSSDQRYIGAEMLLQYSPDLLEFVNAGIADSAACTSVNPEGTAEFEDPDKYRFENDPQRGLVKVVRASLGVAEVAGRVCAATIHFRPKTNVPATAYISFDTLPGTWKIAGSGITHDYRFNHASTVTVNIAGGAIPPSPQLQEPASGSQLSEGNDILLLWHQATHAGEYNVELIDGSGIKRESGWQKALGWYVEPLRVGKYTWRVKARNWKGESEWSAPATFTVAPAPLQPVVLIPFVTR